MRISLSIWLLSNHTVNLHPRVGLRAKFGWDMTENGRKYIAPKSRIEMLHNITYVYMHEEEPYTTHPQPRAGTHVVLEVALAVHLA